MKKGLILICIVMLTVASVNAQNQPLVSKKGVPILPQKGDIALGVCATPFLNFFGNFARISGGAFASPAAWTWANPLAPNTIYGKYFLTDNMAVRGKVRIGKNSVSITKNSLKTGTTTNDFVEDKCTNSTTDIAFSAGIEKRRGYGRLQGFYGVEASISLQGGTKSSYEYGNPLDATGAAIARTNFGTNSLGGGRWVTETSTGAIFGIGVGAFIGCEYFFAPKMSFGGEFGWGIGINQDPAAAGSTEQISEVWDATAGAVKSTTVPSGKTTSFTIDSRQTAGNIFLLFHF
ncbi:MAG: hypothetical protein NTZ33_00825 [Bacteroidetes bacterium]|nr:hypothetical protein [Bacteroidota bacterium]